MSNLTTLPKGDSAWLLRKSIQRIMQQVSVLETNIGSSTTGNSSNTQVIFNDNGVLRGDAGLTYNAATDLLSVGAATITGDLTVRTNKLAVTSTGVGIGTASPATALQVVGEIRSSADISNSSDTVLYSYNGGTAGTVRAGIQLIGSTPEIRSYLSGTTAMTLNATGLGLGGTAVNGIKLLSAVTTAGMPATSGTTQSAGSLRIAATDTTGCLDIGTAGAVSWLQACRRTNLADNFALVLNPNGGDVGIGTTSPNSNANRSTLTLQGAWGGQLDINVGATNHAQFGTDNFSSGASCRIQSKDHIAFKTNNGSVLGAHLNANGSFALQNANSAANGIGITFPATQSASSDANTLDDYEEGTFTATLKGTVSDPTTPVTTTARYTKIGRVVTVTIQFSSVTTTGASGRIQIDGLPFTNNSSLAGTGSVGFNGMATFTGSPFASLSASSSTIAMFASNSAGAYTAVTFNAGTTQDLWTSLTYTV